MYEDRRRVKDNEIKTRGDDYLIAKIEAYIARTGKGKHEAVRDLISDGLDRYEKILEQQKDSGFLTEL